MTEFIWPITLIIVTLIVCWFYLAAVGAKLNDKAAMKLLAKHMDDIRAEQNRMLKRLDKAGVDEITETVEALAEDIDEIVKKSSHVPNEAWMTEKLKPVFALVNAIGTDVKDLKALFARYEALNKLGKTITGGKEQ